jgi:hypothetical protein
MRGLFAGGALLEEASRLAIAGATIFMSKTLMYFLIIAVTLGAVYIGYRYYLESQEGIDIEINKDGVSIDGK